MVTKGVTETRSSDTGSGRSDRSDGQGNESLVMKLMPAVFPVALSGLTAMAYAVLRGSYSQFYSQYGVGPDEVGLSAQQMVMGLLRFCTAQRLPLLGPLKLAVFVAIFAAVWLVVALYCDKAKWFKRPVTPSRAILAVVIYLALLMVILTTTAYFVIPNDFRFASQRIRNSKSVHAHELAYLVVQADRASVVWTDSGHVPADFPKQGGVLMYLGHHNNISVVFDPASRSTWRLPGNKVLIKTIH